MASKVNGVISKINPSGTIYALASNAYGYCETGAATAAKVVDMTGFSLIEGVTVHIKFKNNNTASNPTLNINGTGAKPIMQYGTTVAGTNSSTTGWSAGAILSFTYDGTNWIRDYFYNTTYSAMSASEMKTGTAATSRVMTAANIKSGLPTLFSTGTTPGTFKVYNTEIAIAGLGSNAYSSTNYAPLDSPNLTGTPTAPTALAGTNNTQIATTEFVMNAFAANDAMIFKGTLGTNGTITALPTEHSQGWTYKIITPGTYAGKVCEIGDMIICIADGTNTNDDHWTVIQSNIDGAVIGPTTATDNHIVLFNNTTGKVIKDSGKTIDDLIENFIVTVTLTSTTAGTADKSVSEILTAVQTGKLPIVKTYSGSYYMIATLVYVSSNEAIFVYENQENENLCYATMKILENKNVIITWRGQYITNTDTYWEEY